MSAPLISIVVPVFNLEDRISDCLDSLLSQDYPSIEVILIDDGSTDQSASKIHRIALTDSRVKLLRTTNQGAMKARLTGVVNASGDWITFVDGDDLVDQRMCSSLKSTSAFNHVDIALMGETMVFPDGRTIVFHGTGESKILSHEEGLRELLAGEIIEPGLHAKLYKKRLFTTQLLQKASNAKVAINEDFYLNYLLFSEAQKLAYCDESVYKYLIRENSAATKRNEKHLYDPLRVLDLINCDLSEDSEFSSIILNRQVRHYLYMTQEEQYPKAVQIAKSALLNLQKDDLEKLNSKLAFQVKFFKLFPLLFKQSRKLFNNLTGRDKAYDI